MINFSRLRNCYYDDNDVIYIVNMKQNYKYINAGIIDELIDVINGKDDKLVLVWKKSERLKELYTLWNKHEL